MSRNGIRTAQERDAALPSSLVPIVNATVIETVAALDHRVLPVRARFLRADATARFLGIDKVTMAEWRSKGVGPRYRKIGNRVVYSVDDLVSFVEQHPLQGSGTLVVECSFKVGGAR